MAGRTPRGLRELQPLAQTYQLEFIGVTGKGHYRWRHKPTGRTLCTVSSHASWHSVKNTERDVKRSVQRFEAEHGQHADAD